MMDSCLLYKEEDEEEEQEVEQEQLIIGENLLVRMLNI